MYTLIFLLDGAVLAHQPLYIHIGGPVVISSFTLPVSFLFIFFKFKFVLLGGWDFPSISSPFFFFLFCELNVLMISPCVYLCEISYNSDVHIEKRKEGKVLSFLSSWIITTTPPGLLLLLKELPYYIMWGWGGIYPTS